MGHFIGIKGIDADEVLRVIRTDAEGRLILGTETPTEAGLALVSADALEAARVLKAEPGTLRSLTGLNTAASAQYIQLHDSATVPADTAVPVAVIAVAAGANFEFPLAGLGMDFAAGIVVCNSSTVATKTVGAADCFFTALVG